MLREGAQNCRGESGNISTALCQEIQSLRHKGGSLLEASTAVQAVQSTSANSYELRPRTEDKVSLVRKIAGRATRIADVISIEVYALHMFASTILPNN